MTLLSILIALLLERITPQLVTIRQFNWLKEYIQWFIEVLHIERLGSLGAFFILISPLLVLTWFFTGLFENILFGLFELAFNVAILFFCLGPQDLDSEVEQYLDDIETGDTQQQYKAVGQISREIPQQDFPDQVRQFSKALFVEANTRVYAVLFWFVLLGPVAVVLYRVVERMLHQNMLQAPMQRLNASVRVMLGWLEVLPARITLLAFMLSGSFEGGLKAYRSGSVCARDTYANNHECLQNVGFESISDQGVANNNQALEMVRKSRGLVLRTLVLWLMLIFCYSLFV